MGDLWRLGPHRLVCGDACDPAAVDLALGGAKPRLMVTDPPYGVNYDPAWRDGLVDRRRGPRNLGKPLNDDRVDWREAWKLFAGDVAYVWSASLQIASAEAALASAGFLPRALIVWDKRQGRISRGHYRWRHEICWYAVRKGATANWRGDRKQETVWPALYWGSKRGHSNEKPVEIMRRPMLNHTREGDAVYDPFVGSGTTIVAAHECGRVAHAIELNPPYCDMAIERWEKATGERAARG